MEALNVSRSYELIERMHPSLRGALMKDFDFLNYSILDGERHYCIITNTLRTHAEQAQLYAQGRTKAGKKVTNAKAGDSLHNYGFAFDIALRHRETGKVLWDEQLTEWGKAATFFKAKGWQWGGDWQRFKDYPHFEKSPLSLSELKELYARQQKTYLDIS